MKSQVSNRRARATTAASSNRPLTDSFLAHLTGRYVDVNAAGADMLGYSLKEILGLSIADVVVATEISRIPEELAKLGTDAVVKSQWRFRRKDGSEFQGEVLGRRFSDGRLLGMVRDITERNRIEEALRASEQRLSIAKAAAGLGIHDWDVTTGSIQWDARTRQLWGANAVETITFETFKAGIQPEDFPGVQAAVDRALDPAGDGAYYAEYRVVHRTDGQVHWVAATGQTFFREGRAVRLVGTVQDITERKQAEARQAREVAAMARLQKLGNLYVQEQDFELGARRNRRRRRRDHRRRFRQHTTRRSCFGRRPGRGTPRPSALVA